jgi:hypothetical protein
VSRFLQLAEWAVAPPKMQGTGAIQFGVADDRFPSSAVCDTVIAGGSLMPAPARAMEPPIDTLPLEERIQRRAYELYVQRGNQSGSEVDDWTQAEEEILRAQEDRLNES